MVTIGPIEGEIVPVNFYFRIVKSDRVLSVQADDQEAAEALISEYPPPVESLKPDQIPRGMEFKPSLHSYVSESTTGYTPLPPRPTHPRDPKAKRNP